MAVSQERQDVYCRVLSETGSHFEAARAATPFPNEMKPREDGVINSPSGYNTFLRLRKSDPIFAARVDEAMSIALARAEAELSRRMFVATERATLDRAGNIVHISKDFRNADMLLKTFLARHRPEWIDSQRKSVEATVHHVGGNNAPGSGFGYTIRAADIELLSDEDRKLLGELVGRIEDARTAAKSAPALPAPDDAMTAANAAES
jgi:hypothetical protein